MKKIVFMFVGMIVAVFSSAEAMAGYCVVTLDDTNSSKPDSATSFYSLRYKIQTVYNDKSSPNCTPPSGSPGDGDYFDQAMIFATAEAGYANNVNTITLSDAIELSGRQTLVIGNWSPDVVNDTSEEVGYENDYVDALIAAGDYGVVTIDGTVGDNVNPFPCASGASDVFFRNVIIKTNGISHSEFFGSDDENVCHRDGGDVTVMDEGASKDADGDGHDSVGNGGDDCDDTNSNIYFGAPEVCDGEDNDCDNYVDEGLTSNTYYADNDGDGYGDASASTSDCSAPSGYVSNDDDCDDDAASANPGNSSETCDDGLDNDCDGSVDDGECDDPTTETNCDNDSDEDGDGLIDCDDSDCDDDVACTAGSTEVLCTDGLDNDGDGEKDCDDSNCLGTAACAAETDCDDGVDNDSDGSIDEADADCEVVGVDNDGDGYDSVETGGDDCNDVDITINPGAGEFCGTCTDDTDIGTCIADAEDQDCDGLIDEGCNGSPNVDDDGDGLSENAGDCDDTDEEINPTALEICDDEVDNNCDGSDVSSTEATVGLTCEVSLLEGDKGGGGSCGCDMSGKLPDPATVFFQLMMVLVPLSAASILRFKIK